MYMTPLIIAALGLKIVVAAHKYCPSSAWIYRDGSCYLVNDEPRRSWYDSRAICQSLGGDLVLPRSLEENDFVYRKLFPGYSGHYSTNAWIRCYFNGSQWDCLDDPNDYSKWSTSNTLGNCAIMRLNENGTWRGIDCTRLRRSMCRAPAGQRARSYTCSAISLGDQPRCLTNHTVAEISARSSARCCLACSKDPRCRSFNRRGDACQLSNATASEVDEEYFKIVSDCVYYEPF